MKFHSGTSEIRPLKHRRILWIILGPYAELISGLYSLYISFFQTILIFLTFLELEFFKASIFTWKYKRRNLFPIFWALWREMWKFKFTREFESWKIVHKNLVFQFLAGNFKIQISLNFNILYVFPNSIFSSFLSWLSSQNYNDAEEKGVISFEVKKVDVGLWIFAVLDSLRKWW